MTGMTSYDDTMRAIAHAYRERREGGSSDYPAFDAAIDAYRARHPETNHGEAALTVSNLLQEMPRASCL